MSESLLRLASFLCVIPVLLGFPIHSKVHAQNSKRETAIEKIAVFPILYQGDMSGLGRGSGRGGVDEATAKSLDDTWWIVRDELTSTNRFVVASRAFLQKADAFQPRGKMTVGDAVILGRYVEADALLTMTLKDRSFTMSVSMSHDGTALWSATLDLHPSVLIREQIANVAKALVREFVASFPYQTATADDALSKKAVFTDGRRQLARVKWAPKEIEVGDPVEWVTVERESLGALFQGAARVKTVAQGVVFEVKDQGVVVEIQRSDSANAVSLGSLVLFPKEKARLIEASKLKDSATSKAVVSLLAVGAPGDSNNDGAQIQPEGKLDERRRDESGIVATTLSILGSLAVILLLAF